MAKKIFLSILIFWTVSSAAQDFGYYGNLVSQQEQEASLTYLADEMTRGRGSGSQSSLSATQFIADKFRECCLLPVDWNYTQSFRYNDTVVVRNVVGILPASRPSDEYVVVSAHYDHLGEINGRLYCGADDNASGVTALLSIAKAMRQMRTDGTVLGKNVIFVAFDGKELNMSGSEYFVKHLPVSAKAVLCDVNLDMLGTDLVPPGKSREYLIQVGEETLPARYQGNMNRICWASPYRLDLDQSFYGSRDFRKMFYKMSDQASFSKAGIPAVVFSSAFHDHTYKITDKKEIINFPLLYKRTLVILRFVTMLCD